MSMRLSLGEIEFIARIWREGRTGPAAKMLKQYAGCFQQIQLLIWASGLTPRFDLRGRGVDAQLPWHDRDEYEQRLLEAQEELQRRHPAMGRSGRLVPPAFSQQEADFLMCWYQEFDEADRVRLIESDWLSIPRWRMCWSQTNEAAWPSLRDAGIAHRLACTTFGTCSETVATIEEMCLGLLTARNLRPSEAAGGPMPRDVSLPWNSWSELRGKWWESRAYLMRVEKLNEVPKIAANKSTVDLSTRERDFLETWLQETIRCEPGKAYQIRELHAANVEQIRNLIWASGMEIALRPVPDPEPWPWDSAADFNERVALAGEWLLRCSEPGERVLH
jgi:hypothetical protein